MLTGFVFACVREVADLATPAALISETGEVAPAIEAAFRSLPRLAAGDPQLAGYGLDFILNCSFRPRRGETGTAARFGTWAFHSGDQGQYSGAPPGLWEIHRGDPVTGVCLRGGEGGGFVLAQMCVPTEGRSQRANQRRILDASPTMLRWACLDVLNGGTADWQPAPTAVAGMDRPRGARNKLRCWGRMGASWLRYKLANQCIDEWNVGWIRASPEAFLDPEFRPDVQWSGYREKGQMIADPFLAPAAQGVRILCEEFSWHAGSGRILEMQAAADGSLSLGVPAIDEPVHMSFPYVLEYNGTLYCMPECAQRRGIPLYRWDGGSASWQEAGWVMRDVPAVDATVFEAYGSWWLLHSLSLSGGGAGRWSLFVWRSDNPFGPWQPHERNPVKVDVTSSRPAGRPFWVDGVLYRPAQDGTNGYGGGLAINRVEALSLREFRETTVRRIAPQPDWPYPHGIHTLNGASGMSVIDAKRQCWPAGLILRRLGYRLAGRTPQRSFQYSGGGFRLVKDLNGPARQQEGCASARSQSSSGRVG